jgi:hypothetical protein
MAVIRTERDYEVTRQRLLAMQRAGEKYHATLKGAGFSPEHVELRTTAGARAGPLSRRPPWPRHQTMR